MFFLDEIQIHMLYQTTYQQYCHCCQTVFFKQTFSQLIWRWYHRHGTTWLEMNLSLASGSDPTFHKCLAKHIYSIFFTYMELVNSIILMGERTLWKIQFIMSHFNTMFVLIRDRYELKHQILLKKLFKMIDAFSMKKAKFC